jgi:hypothetical protein
VFVPAYVRIRQNPTDPTPGEKLSAVQGRPDGAQTCISYLATVQRRTATVPITQVGRHSNDGGSVPRLMPNLGGYVLPLVHLAMRSLRISRSSTAAGIGVAFPFPATSSAPGMSSFQAYPPLTTSTLEYVCPFGRVQVYWIRSPVVW